MGIYKSTYVGVYITINNTIKQVKESYRTNKQGKKYTNGEKFDPVTGEELLKITNIKPKVETHNWVFSDIEVDGINEDEFFSPEYTKGKNNENRDGYVTLIMNSTGNTYTLAHFHGDEETISISQIDVENILGKFSREYRKYLDYLQEQNLSYNVNYGIVCYAH